MNIEKIKQQLDEKYPDKAIFINKNRSVPIEVLCEVNLLRTIQSDKSFWNLEFWVLNFSLLLLGMTSRTQKSLYTISLNT